MAVCILRTRCVVLVSAYDLRFVCYCVPRCQLVLCSFILFLSSLTWSRTAGSFLVYAVFVGSGPIFRLQVLFFPSRCLFLSHVVRAYPRSNPRCVFWQTSYPKWSLAPQQIVQQSRTFLDGGVLGPLGSLRSASCQQPQLTWLCIYLASFKLLLLRLRSSQPCITTRGHMTLLVSSLQ